MNETMKADLYRSGLEWGKTHASELRSFTGEYDDFKRWMRELMRQERFMPEAVFTTVRVYNAYTRYPDEAEGYFVAGVSDALNGTSSADMIPT